MSQRLAAALAPTRARVRKRDADDWAAKEQALIADCHPHQRDFVLDDNRRICALVGRGGGKTTGVLTRFVRRLKNTPRAKCLYIATTREQAVDLLWEPLKQLCDRLGMVNGVDVKFNETALRCTFLNEKSQLKLAGADDKKQIEKYRGMPHHEVWIDESASFPHKLLEHLIDRVIGPRLGDYRGTLGLVGTPGHILAGPFYEATRPGSDQHRLYADRHLPEFEGWETWSFHRWTLEQAAASGKPALVNQWEEAQVQKRAKGWSDKHPVWLREYCGQWAADDTDHVFRYRPHDEDGAELNQWDPPKDPRTGIAILPKRDGKPVTDWRYVLGMDTGSRDPLAIGVYAFSPTDASKTLYHIYEHEQRGMFARTIAELLIGARLEASEPEGLIGALGQWPDAMVADAYEVLLDELRNVYGIVIERADKRAESRFASIELANGDLVDGRTKILKGSRLEEQLMNLQWAKDDFGEQKKDKSARDDQADQFIYARRAAQHLLSEEAPPPKPFFPPKSDPMHVDRGGRDESADMLSDDYYDADGLWE